jgi:hypothetical protein
MIRWGIFALATAGVILLWLQVARVEKLRYSITVELRTPDGVRQGVGVQELVSHPRIPWLPGGDAHHVEFKGEAVPIEVADGIVFFIGDADWLLSQALARGEVKPPVDTEDAQSWPRSRPKMMRALRRAQSTAILRARDLPPSIGWRGAGFIHFADSRYPTTLTRTDAADLAMALGPGVELQAIRFEVTDAPVSYRLETWLPWLGNLKRYRRDPNSRFSSTIPADIRTLRDSMDL